MDVEIQFTGLRPGEKLFEELFHGREPPVPTGFPGLLMANPRTADPAIVGRAIDEIAAACRGGQARLALALIGRLVPEFEHNAEGSAPARRERLIAERDPMTDAAAPFRSSTSRRSRRRIAADLRRRVEAVFEHCQFVLGPEVAELERALAAFCGAKHCVSVSSGTDALQIAMMAEGIGRGDAVFLPAFTYTATAEVPLVLGATPVFVDVDPRTFQIDIAHLERRIADTRRTGKLSPRAIIGVDLFGQPADWPALAAIAAREGLFTLDDCAQSFGASLHGERLGRAADATATSFFPSKPLGAYGDGGALFTESEERAALYRSLRTHGEGTTRYEVLRTGMNGRLEFDPGGGAASQACGVRGGTGGPRADRGAYDARLGTAVETPAPRAGQRERLGDLCDPAAGRRGARRHADRLARAGRAERDLLSAPAAQAAGLSRPSRRHCAARVRRSGEPHPGAADPSRT